MSDKRHKFTVQDDDYSISDAVRIFMLRVPIKEVKNIIKASLCSLAEKYKKNLSDNDKDFFDSMIYEVYKKYNRKKSLSMYKARNFIMKIIEMVAHNIDYKAIDEKKKDLLNQLSLNRHNKYHQKLLRKLTHKDYDKMKRQVGIAKVHHNMNLNQIKTIGYDGLMKLEPEHDNYGLPRREKAINIEAKKVKNDRH